MVVVVEDASTVVSLSFSSLIAHGVCVFVVQPVVASLIVVAACSIPVSVGELVWAVGSDWRLGFFFPQAPEHNRKGRRGPS